ncbi:MAG: hypothetical protein GY830_11010, partial [Bacteroidetes bacterium]|nr:hypothetical protein [Bacteroidota bacterium]
MKKQIFKIKKIKNSFYLFSVFIFIIACSDKQIKFMQTKSEVRSVTTNRNNPSNFQGRGRGRGRGRDRDRRTKYKNFNEYLNADSSSDDSGNFGLNNGFEGYIKQNKKFQKEPNINHNEDEDLDCLDFENYIKQNKKFQKEPNINHNEDEDLDCLDERFGNNHIGIYKFNIILNNDLQHKYENKKIKKASEDDKINSESKSEEKEGINSESKSEEKEEIKCLICKKFLGPYIRILKCGHKIHRDCVNNWINT